MGMGKAKKQKLNTGTVLFCFVFKNEFKYLVLVKALEIRTLNLANWLAAEVLFLSGSLKSP